MAAQGNALGFGVRRSALKGRREFFRPFRAENLRGRDPGALPRADTLRAVGALSTWNLDPDWNSDPDWTQVGLREEIRDDTMTA
jgi:hypothetical protein